MKHNYIKAIILFALLAINCTLAVTDEEVRNIQEAMPEKAVIQPAEQRTLLVFSLCSGFKHSSIPYWIQALDVMGEKTGAFKVVHSDDMAIFTSESLKQFDVICFNNTTQLVPDETQQQAILDFIMQGKGIVGIHAATDNFNEWPEGMEMMGGVFKGHPWGGGGTWAVKIDDPDHPLMKSFKGQGFKIKDEIYRTAAPLYSRQKQRVLMSLDMSDPATKNAEGVEPDDMDTGISWIKPVGKGRLFYCSLGHDHAVTWNTAVLEHYLAGIQYAIGDLKVDDSPLAPETKEIDTDALDDLIDPLREYDWGQSRKPLVQLQDFIREHCQSTEAVEIIESHLLKVLGADVSLATKDFICRQLAVIGTEKSIAVLSEMLPNPETSNIARYALEKIPDTVVDETLLEIAKKTSDREILIGILSTLANRKSEHVVSLSRDIFADTSKSDEAVKIAVIYALGAVGTEGSVAELLRIRPEVTGQTLERCLDALLMNADALRKINKNKQAAEIYKDLYQTASSSLIRASALMGLTQAGVKDSEGILTQAIKDEDLQVRTAAIQSLAYADDHQLIKSIVEDASGFPETMQIQLLTVLSEKSQDVCRSFAMQMVQSPQEAVRIAAYQALMETGDESAVAILATAAGQASDRKERAAAQAVLYGISGKKIDLTISEMVASSAKQGLDEKMVVELIKATVNRQIKDATQVLFQTAKSDNRKISSESIRAIQSLAGPEHARYLVDLLISKPGTAMENASVVIAEKYSKQDLLTAMILDEYSEVPDVESKASLLRVLGKLGDVDAIPLLNTTYTDSNEGLKDAAFRAMTDWPGNEYLKKMKALAQSGSDEKTKLLAFRAYIRMLENSGISDQKQIVKELALAYAIAERSEERKIVIGSLGNYGEIQALRFVQKKLEDTTLRAEAEVSLIQICEKLMPQDSSVVTPVLRSLVKDGSSESVRNRAQGLLDKTR